MLNLLKLFSTSHILTCIYLHFTIEPVVVRMKPPTFTTIMSVFQ